MTTITFTEQELNIIHNCVQDYDAIYGNEDTEWDFDDVEGMRDAAAEVLNIIAGKLNIERTECESEYEYDDDDDDDDDDRDDENVEYDCNTCPYALTCSPENPHVCPPKAMVH